MVWELMHLANERMRSLEMSGSDSVARVMATTSAFDCACVEDLWNLISKILGQIEFLSIYNIANKTDPMPFDTAHAEVKPDGDDRANDDDCYFFNLLEENPRFRRTQIWLLFNLCSLLGTSSAELTSQCYAHAESILKTSIEELDTKYSEDEFKSRLLVAARLGLLWGPNLAVLSHLWEFIHKKLHQSLKARTISLDRLASIPRNVESWSAMLKLTDKNLGSCSAQDLLKDYSDPYGIFLFVLEVHLAQCSGEKKKLFAKFLGRVRSKITPKKLRELNDIGWFRLHSLLLVCTKVSPDPSDTTAKWLDMFRSIKSSEIKPKQTHLLGMAMAAVLLMCKECDAKGVVRYCTA